MLQLVAENPVTEARAHGPSLTIISAGTEIYIFAFDASISGVVV